MDGFNGIVVSIEEDVVMTTKDKSQGGSSQLVQRVASDLSFVTKSLDRVESVKSIMSQSVQLLDKHCCIGDWKLQKMY